MNTIFEQHLGQVLQEEFDVELKAAVGVVQDGDRWLLGLAKNTSDDRSGKWVFPGGHIKRGEDPKRAAAREVKEETGVSCRAVGEHMVLPDRKHVAFFHCKVNSSKQDLNPNSEFAAVGFFTTREMKSLKLYDNVKKLIDRVKRRC
jgi:8-oxo-dGTP pyrophosphatase MutT (NUDIX family)